MRRELRLRVDRVAEVAPGHVIVDAIVATVGVYDYGDHAEFVPAETLFDAEGLATLQGAPITVQHPDSFVGGDGDPDVVGAIAEVIPDPEHGVLRAKIRLWGADAFAAIKAGTQELSAGYHATIEERAGEFDGKHYDAVQVARVYDHTAIVDIARAGRRARLYFDGSRGMNRKKLIKAFCDAATALVAHDRKGATKADEVEIVTLTLPADTSGETFEVSIPKDAAEALVESIKAALGVPPDTEEAPAPAAEEPASSEPAAMDADEEAEDEGDPDDEKADAKIDARIDARVRALLAKREADTKRDAAERTALMAAAKDAMPTAYDWTQPIAKIRADICARLSASTKAKADALASKAATSKVAAAELRGLCDALLASRPADKLATADASPSGLSLAARSRMEVR